ncbi:unnamed protein product [marine sediment metagenome]|uniref:Uncharacterized protein n=1 Tax=marine sediment metagenome TaxID=412755 RepID=X1TNZ5_9ZZZZ
MFFVSGSAMAAQKGPIGCPYSGTTPSNDRENGVARRKKHAKKGGFG